MQFTWYEFGNRKILRSLLKIARISLKRVSTDWNNSLFDINLIGFQARLTSHNSPYIPNVEFFTSDELSRCDWYTLPPKMRRMYALLLSDTQNPVELSSYACITSERETSKRVSNSRIHSKMYTFQFINFPIDSQNSLFILFDISKLWAIDDLFEFGQKKVYTTIEFRTNLLYSGFSFG